MIADLKSYPAYKDSGVPWLGDVPAHWDLHRLKHVCRFVYGDSLPQEGRQSGEIPVFGSNGRVGWHNVANTLQPCLIIGRKGSFGKVNYSHDRVFAIDTTFFIDSRSTTANLRWLHYLLNWVGLDAVSRDSAVPGLDREEAYQRVLPIAPMGEQSGIARYLDHVDHRIRRAIHAKQKLIALLDEQKQAIIHQAVTRGLDPNVRLKPSGVEWLGEVPEHWEVSRLKFEASHIVDCLHATPTYVPNGAYPAIRTADVEPGRLRLQTAKRISEDQYALWTSRLVPQAGDILYTREGERYGLAALVPTGVALCISQRMMAFRILPRQRSEYLMWQLNCRHVYAQAAADVIGATAPHVNIERIRNYEIILPPLNEQDQIVAWISSHCSELEKVIDEARREITLLREYRTRLIADVVTGKVDVRAAAQAWPDEVEELEPLDEVDAMGDTGEESTDDLDAAPGEDAE